MFGIKLSRKRIKPGKLKINKEFAHDEKISKR